MCKICRQIGSPDIAVGLLAWIEGACVWELNRRRGFVYPLQPPEAAIDPSEEAVSINAAIAMRATFAQDSPAVRAVRCTGGTAHRDREPELMADRVALGHATTKAGGSLAIGTMKGRSCASPVVESAPRCYLGCPVGHLSSIRPGLLPSHVNRQTKAVCRRKDKQVWAKGSQLWFGRTRCLAAAISTSVIREVLTNSCFRIAACPPRRPELKASRIGREIRQVRLRVATRVHQPRPRQRSTPSVDPGRSRQSPQRHHPRAHGPCSPRPSRRCCRRCRPSPRTVRSGPKPNCTATVMCNLITALRTGAS